MVHNALKLFKLLSGSGPEPQELLINLFRYKLIAKSQRKKRSEMPIVLLARAMKIQTITIITVNYYSNNNNNINNGVNNSNNNNYDNNNDHINV